MEPDSNQEPPPPQVSKTRMFFRMALLPVAFAWLAFLLLAPFALFAGEIVAIAALAFGAAFGIALLIVNPKWVRKVMSSDFKRGERTPRPQRPITTTDKVLLSSFSVLLATATGYFLMTTDLKERGVFTLIAVLLVIDLIRRPLRRAWGLNGSAVGLMISGGLIVLLLRSTSLVEPGDWLLMILIAGILLAVDVAEEFRALKRAGLQSSADSAP